MTPAEIVQRTRHAVAQRMHQRGAGHGMDHVDRVRNCARIIHAEVGGDSLVIDLAALLHDVGDAKFHHGVERSGEFSKEILDPLGVNKEIITQVVHIVDHISFRSRDRGEELTLEGKIVQDADRLDALGAIGIVRTIEFGASIDQPFHDPSSPSHPSGIQHFHEKLFRLRELMNTDIAKRMAKDREDFMRLFLNQYMAEYAVTEPAHE